MRNRTGIILVCKDEILLIKRIKNGNQYYVIPGGGIEKDEDIISAAVREIREEINLEINKEDINKFCEIKNQDRTEIYFITEIKKQKFIICGEEAERSNADNVYILGDIGREGSNKDNEYLCKIIYFFVKI